MVGLSTRRKEKENKRKDIEIVKGYENIWYTIIGKS
jgi:hypothetical protein